MISYFQAIILGGVQGITELFPVSSLGHSIIVPALLGWHLDVSANYFLMFLVATHFATALVLFLFFWKDWKKIISGIFTSIKERKIETLDAKLGWLLIIGTVPAGIIGLLFQKQIQKLFISPMYVALFLILNGVMLFAAEFLRKKSKAENENGDIDHAIASKLTFWQSVKIGTMQIIALIPGFSRTGATITGGFLVGLSRGEALRYSFLLATPIIAAAGLLKLPELLLSHNTELMNTAFVGALAAAVTAYVSITYLTKYFRTKKLGPFALYCILIGILTLLIL